MNHFRDVYNFHLKFDLPRGDPPGLMDSALMQFRLGFLREELREFEDAHDAGDYVAAADSLVDLVYVAIGTAVVMGVPWDECWTAVHNANMRKQKAKPDGSDSKRGSAHDVVKPEGWRSPEVDLKRIIEERRRK